MMKRAVSRFLPSRSNSSSTNTASTASSFKKKSSGFLEVNLINDFYIELQEPHKLWKPSEVLKGEIVLELKKNVTDINITLTLKGSIKIKPSTPATATRNKPYTLFDYTIVIYGEEVLSEIGNVLRDNDEPLNGLSKGIHRFPFEMKLPRKNIYTSISFEKGSIGYALKASINHNSVSSSPNSFASTSSSSPKTLDQASKSNISSASSASLVSSLITSKHSIQYCEKNLNILVPINVAKIPKPQTKVASLRASDKKLMKTMSSTSTINSSITQFSSNSQNSEDSSSSNHSQSNQKQRQQQQQLQPTSIASPSLPDSSAAVTSIRLSVDLPESGYLRGEIIPVKIKLNHYKPIHSPNGVIVTLTRVCRVDNGPGTPIQSFRKDLSQRITPLFIDPVTLTAEVSTSLKVPSDAFPTIIGSTIVTFQYYIEVLANISSRSVLNNSSVNAGYKAATKEKLKPQNLLFDLDNEPQQLHNGYDIGTAHGNSDGAHNSDPLPIINVDKLKRAKHFLGLNTEVIVGTERTIKKSSSSSVAAAAASKTRPNTVNSRLSSTNNIQLYMDSDTNSSPNELDSASRSSISPLNINVHQPQSINSRPASTSQGRHPTTSNCNSTAQSTHYPTPPETSYVNEKETLRTREESIPLPSELLHLPPAPSYYQHNHENSEDLSVVENDENLNTLPVDNFEPSAPPMSVMIHEGRIGIPECEQGEDDNHNNDSNPTQEPQGEEEQDLINQAVQDMATLRNHSTVTTVLAPPSFRGPRSSSSDIGDSIDEGNMDKNELELRRLQALESEAPSGAFDFLPRYSSKPEDEDVEERGGGGGGEEEHN
ncbi:hypothetical protein WICPIJ_000234 [Wickerhamomyces pijperi]|uniref:pH-response regulator protein palF/RIM8 n=1 Tax=Wickerhamomyces pijperi TaxID=599730 RepID=A0A9P8TS76_WICPI|nr:hypothetical protein WICPIJ_000234 [Wickerhamomyces pijperi]